MTRRPRPTGPPQPNRGGACLRCPETNRLAAAVGRPSRRTASGAVADLSSAWSARPDSRSPSGLHRQGSDVRGRVVAQVLAEVRASQAREPEEAPVTEQSAERRPIGWWLKTADARIEQVFEDAFESQSITRREWQVLEPVSHAPVPESELLHKLEAFAGAQDAVDELRRRGLLANGGDGVLTLTDAGLGAWVRKGQQADGGWLFRRRDVLRT